METGISIFVGLVVLTMAGMVAALLLDKIYEVSPRRSVKLAQGVGLTIFAVAAVMTVLYIAWIGVVQPGIWFASLIGGM